MTKIRMFMFAALAAFLVFGVSGQAQTAWEPHVKMMAVPMSHPVDPDAASKLHTTQTGMAVGAPADSSGNAYWPCFTGTSDPDCSSIPEGALVNGWSLYTWNLPACTSSSAACGEIYWFVEDDFASTKYNVVATVTVTQGTSTIYTNKYNYGKNPGSGYIFIVAFDAAFGVGDCFNGGTCVAPVAGAAVISTTFTIGSQQATSKATILLSASGGA